MFIFLNKFQVDLAIEDIKQKDEHDIMLYKCRKFSLKFVSPLQEQAYNVFTQFDFQKFEEEFERCTQYQFLMKMVM